MLESMFTDIVQMYSPIDTYIARYATLQGIKLPQDVVDIEATSIMQPNSLAQSLY